ncbi:uncharacterized protein [Macrobrachium rosenbergii]|uniref:uncharacterized protein n=1 Tax=Macrobrachium rosenbergii TaxID=79674 RepID=UPI0034D7939B
MPMAKKRVKQLLPLVIAVAGVHPSTRGHTNVHESNRNPDIPNPMCSISRSVFFILDSTKGTRFLGDTWACHSLLPVSIQPTKHPQPTYIQLTTANSSPILTFGKKHLTLNLGNRKYHWWFITVRHLNTSPQGRLLGTPSTAHGLCQQLAVAKKNLRRDDEDGFVSKGIQSFGIPPAHSNKKDGTLHPSGDYRRLNVITEADHYLPFLHGTKISSKLGLLKCYSQREEFLGHLITPEGVHPLTEKVTTIRKFPTPTTLEGLQEFLGMVNYYHHFLPDTTSTLTPLYDVLKGKPKAPSPGDPSRELPSSPSKCPHQFHAPSFPAPDHSLLLSMDASNIAIGAALEQIIHSCPRPLAFFSRKLSKTETNYSTFDHELLAAYLTGKNSPGSRTYEHTPQRPRKQMPARQRRTSFCEERSSALSHLGLVTDDAQSTSSQAYLRAHISMRRRSNILDQFR